MARRQIKALQTELKERLAQESARLMIEHGIVDFRLAKRKAADNLSVAGLGGLPSNSQIEACLAERQRIFEGDRHAERLWHLRDLALRVMRQLSAFEPRLTGPVLSGTATNNSRIELHVFASSAETVGATLDRFGYRWSPSAQRYRYGGGRQIQVPAYRFQADGACVSLPVFAENGIREAPLSSVDQKPVARASQRELERLQDCLPLIQPRVSIDR